MPDSNLSRRLFLGSVGSTFLAAAVQGQATLAPPDKQPPNLKLPPGTIKKVNYAVVGLGELSLDEIMPAFGECKLSQPYALVSGHRDKAEKVADTYRVDRQRIYNYDNFDKIAEDPAIEVVYNVLPNHMHAEYTIRALKAGKHVLCEKPMAPTSAECREMIRVSKETGKKLMIAYRLRYEPHTKALIQLVRDKKIGNVRAFEAQNMQITVAPNIRLSQATKGGPVEDIGVYCINAARYATGEEPVELFAMQHQPKENPNFAEVPETVSIMMRFPSGILANCLCGFNGQTSRYLRVNGDAGWAEMHDAFSYEGQRLRVWNDKQLTELQQSPVNQFASEMDYFSDCVLNDKPVLTDGEEGLRDIVVVEAIRKSIETKAPVPVELAGGRAVEGQPA
jgi:predicted dehydrogenase